MAEGVRLLAKDANGVTFESGALPHQYMYDANNNMLTDTCFEQGAVVRQKMYTWEEGANGVWLKGTESAWINVTEGWRG
jgi:hypothetical protein